jgi:hypothetical protein
MRAIESLLKDRGFSHREDYPNNELLHSSNKKMAVITDGEVAIKNYRIEGGNILKYESGEMFNSMQSLRNHLDNTHTYAGGGQIESISDLYESEEASKYPYARDMVAYFIFGDKDNTIGDAIKGKHTSTLADESQLSEIMLGYEYTWQDNMEDIDVSTVEALGDLMDYYAKGGSVRRINNSPMLRYVNFEDGWHINLLKLKPYTNQNGKPYKGNNKYGISRVGGEQGQEVWEFETLNEADRKFNELVELGKTYSKIEKQGEAKDNYEEGGEITLENFKYDPTIDYMSEYDKLPIEISSLINSEKYINEDGDSTNEEELLSELEKKGWTFEHDMSGGYYGLRPVGEPEQEF